MPVAVSTDGGSDFDSVLILAGQPPPHFFGARDVLRDHAGHFPGMGRNHEVRRAGDRGGIGVRYVLAQQLVGAFGGGMAGLAP